MPNHLVGETSPYLKQHKDNPVDWYPWNDEALRKAKEEEKPIFLSIGYAACHWCHVMAHESFENTEIATFLNANFVSIKVDREERPDLDNIYMQAVVLLTGQGGWPMSVFLTPDIKPFFGGSYFPPTPAHGLPSFQQVLESVLSAWENKKTAVEKNAEEITNAINSQFSPPQTNRKLVKLESVVERLYQNYDWEWGGWGNAPKFPMTTVLEFLIQSAYYGNQHALALTEHILDRMSRGGMYDLVGGGFHRYSTDAHWLVPHFEKMLYDNALLSLAYLHGYSITRNPRFKQVAVDTLEFLQRELVHPEGGFYASLDADSPEGEGHYYTYHYQTLRKALSKTQFNLLSQVTTICQEGNFEGQLQLLQLKDDLAPLARILNIPLEDLHKNLRIIFSVLHSTRSERIPPDRDDKIITAWNGLAIRAFAEAGLLLDRDDLLAAARKTTHFLLTNLMDKEAGLSRTWQNGIARHPGTLEDYAALILALGTMYEVDFDPSIYQMMHSLFQMMQTKFTTIDEFYYDTAVDTPHLITQPLRLQDNPLPSGNAIAAQAHWLIGHYEHETQHIDRAKRVVTQMGDLASQHPTSFGYWLGLANRINQPARQIALLTDKGLDSLVPFLMRYRSNYHPNSIIAAKSTQMVDKGHPKMLDNLSPLDEKPTAYYCKAFTCQAPVTDFEDFTKQLISSR